MIEPHNLISFVADLAAYNFWLFLGLNTNLLSIRFDSKDEIVAIVFCYYESMLGKLVG